MRQCSSRLNENCSCFNGVIKLASVIHNGASRVSIGGSGWTVRKYVIKPDGI